MFPITHIWFAEKVIGFINNSIILGAIFPDIVITGCLEYRQTHYCGWKLVDYLKKSCPDFAQAVATHTVNPQGLDYYGDESYKSGYKGYCFQKGRFIEDQVIDACNIPKEFGLWKAHNFIEMGIELNVSDKNKHLVEALHRAFMDKDAVAKVSEPIERFYNLKKGEISDSYKRFAEYIELEESNCHTLAMKYDIQMKSRHSIAIDIEKAAGIIDCCRSLVDDDIQEFTEYCITKVKSMLVGGVNNE